MHRSSVALVLLLALSVGLGGCVSELLETQTVSRRSFACTVLDGDGPPVLFGLHRERGVQRVPLGEMSGIADFLAREGFGERGRFSVFESSLLEGEGPWTREDLAAWAQRATVVDGDAVRLHVLWVSGFADEAPTTMVVAPGVVAVSEQAVRQGAARLERSEEFLAGVLLWHVVGHALGAVNQGIPLSGTDAAAQEGAPGHEPEAQSVLHAGWDRVATMPAVNGTHDGYSASVVEDWRYAVDEGVCA